MSDYKSWLRGFRQHEAEIEQGRRIVEEQLKKDPSLAEPFVFPKHQKHLKYFGVGICAATALYMTLFADFSQLGESDHIFSGIRRAFYSQLNNILQPTKEDEKFVKLRMEELTEKVSTIPQSKE